MSICHYYSPELVQALMRERILDGQEARRVPERRSGWPAVRMPSSLARLLPRRSQSAACASC
jgi:hypothetical protein